MRIGASPTSRRSRSPEFTSTFCRSRVQEFVLTGGHRIIDPLQADNMHKALLAAIIALGGLQSLPGQTILAGRVLHEGTSSPIASAHVSLTRFPPDLPLTDATRDAVGNVAASLQSPRLSSPDFLRGVVTGTAIGLGVS